MKTIKTYNFEQKANKIFFKYFFMDYRIRIRKMKSESGSIQNDMDPQTSLLLFTVHQAVTKPVKLQINL